MAERCRGRLRLNGGPRLSFWHQSVEDLEESIDNGLAKRVPCFCDFVVGPVASGERQIATLLSDNGA